MYSSQMKWEWEPIDVRPPNPQEMCPKEHCIGTFQWTANATPHVQNAFILSFSSLDCPSTPLRVHILHPLAQPIKVMQIQNIMVVPSVRTKSPPRNEGESSRSWTVGSIVASVGSIVGS